MTRDHERGNGIAARPPLTNDPYAGEAVAANAQGR